MISPSPVDSPCVLADAEDARHLYLFKQVSRLRLTRQIRLLVFRAATEGRTLVLQVPRRCLFDAGLLRFVRKVGILRREELP